MSAQDFSGVTADIYQNNQKEAGLKAGYVMNNGFSFSGEYVYNFDGKK